MNDNRQEHKLNPDWSVSDFTDEIIMWNRHLAEKIREMNEDTWITIDTPHTADFIEFGRKWVAGLEDPKNWIQL